VTESLPAALFLVFGIVFFFAAITGLSFHFWRRVLREPVPEDHSRCQFSPRHLVLKGNHGDVLRATIHINGPPGMAFTTFAEEAWWLALPSSGMTPQDLDIVVYTEHAPQVRRHMLTLRAFPADVQLPIDELKIELRLRNDREPKRAHPR
jgi:hypothetical protein